MVAMHPFTAVFTNIVEDMHVITFSLNSLYMHSVKIRVKRTATNKPSNLTRTCTWYNVHVYQSCIFTIIFTFSATSSETVSTE